MEAMIFPNIIEIYFLVVIIFIYKVQISSARAQTKNKSL